ncbi:MAG: trigger factor, partial [Candidatus Saccharimonadales bacterium]
MPITKERTSPTSIKLTVNADQLLMNEVKGAVLKRLSREVKVSGFRVGKAPPSMAEKQIDPSLLQSEFLDEAVNRLYAEAIKRENVRPVDQPKVTVGKFVPYTTLELVVEVEVIGEVSLPDYTKIKLAKKPVSVSEKEIDNVVHELQLRAAARIDVKRPAEEGDQLIINFSGKDAKTNVPIKGADETNYPLIIGSNVFIPGFETHLIGMKPGEKKMFNIVFPQDYSVSALQNRKVIFDVTVTKVQTVADVKVDDNFAAQAGPFKTVAELRADIRKQLLGEKQSEATRVYDNELLEKIASETKVAIPEVLVTEDVKRIEQQARQNVSYKSQTWPEYLKELGKSEEEYLASLRETAERRVKIGLVLTEVANREQITVTPEEFKIQLQALKGQYQD